MYTEALRADQIATYLEPHLGTKLSERAIHKRKGIEAFLIGQDLNQGKSGGRPAKLYSAEALKLWMRPAEATTEYATPKPKRKRRNDCTMPRKCTPEQWTKIVRRVQGLYLANAQQNLKLACEEGVRQLREEGEVIGLNVYRRLFNKAKDEHFHFYLSEFWRDNWRELHRAKWQKLNHRHDLGTNGYDWPKFFERAGWASGPTEAGPGYGAGRVWVIDGRSSDAWARTTDSRDPRTMKLPNALYIRDGLTGYPLWIEPIESESAEAIKTALLKCMFYWRFTPDIALALDGGIAMSSEETVQIISHMLPSEAWQRATAFPDFFGVRGSPILRNLPYRPNAAFKGRLERGNRQLKDEYDATRHARSFQGGNRSEAVQIRLSNQPTMSGDTPLYDSYFDQMREWVYGDYVHRERPTSASMSLMVKRGLPPTLEAAFLYYGGKSQPDRLPHDEHLAYILYWFTMGQKNRRGTATIKGNGVSCRIDGEPWPVACTGITFRHQGEKVCVVPIPGDPLHAIVMHLLNGDETKPQFLGIGVRNHIDDPEHVGYQRRATTKARETYIQEIREELKNTEQATWRNHTTPDVVDDRALPGWLGGGGDQLPADEPPQLTAAASADDPIELAPDTYELLRDIGALDSDTQL
jgi:hypothetical protein